jgi:hypothetical protein
VPQARHRVCFPRDIEGVGKWALDGSGKYPVNKDGEGTVSIVIASEVKHSITPQAERWIASSLMLLATIGRES